MKTPVVAAIAGLALASTPTFAADLFGPAPPPMSFPAGESPTAEVGTNWYLRGDVGYGVEDEPTVVPSAGLIPQILTDPGTGATYVNAPNGDASHNVGVTRGFNKTTSGPTFDVAVGYRVNNFLRLEGSYAYWNGPGLSYSQATLCPETTTAVSNQVIVAPATTPTSVPAGNLWEPASCNGYLHATQHNNTLLANAYLDLGDYWGLTPYIGAGAGINMNTISGATSFFTTADGKPFVGNTAGGTPNVWVVQDGTLNGAPYYVPLSTQPHVDFGPQNWNRTFNSTRFSMAVALMAGFGYQISPSATLDLGYRYLNADMLGGNKNTAQQVLLGIRYMAN